MCSCQAYGKSGVPNARGFCLVCGELVDPVIASEDQEAQEALDADEPVPTSACPVFRPDHNGECLLCDGWADAHTPEALAAGEQLAALMRTQTGDWDVDRCQVCNAFLGIGLRVMHLGLCEACRVQKEREG